MRDAFGGTFLMYLIIIFITIFVTFMAETLKFVQAYRVKNVIVNYIEQYEGFNETVIAKLEDEKDGYLAKASYNAKKAVTAKEKIPTKAGEEYCSKTYGYCVKMKYSDANQAYYQVSTYISLDFTKVLFMQKPITIPIKGETRFVTYTK